MRTARLKGRVSENPAPHIVEQQQDENFRP